MMLTTQGRSLSTSTTEARHLDIHAVTFTYSPRRITTRLNDPSHASTSPTRRITLEQIVWHLIHEHGVQPRRPDWHQVLWRHETHFRDTQRTNPWPYDPPFNLSSDI